MNVLVTGAGGFLGYKIAEILKSKKYNVTNLSRNHYVELDNLEIKTIKADLANLEDLQSIDFSQFDAIFHVAAKAGVWGDEESYKSINYIGSKNIVDMAKMNGVQYFIYTSSPSVVFADDDIINGNESISYPEEYYTYYAKYKAIAEKYILDADSKDFHTVSLRPHLIWGPRDPHIFPRLIQKAKSGRLKIVGDGTNLVDIIHVDNAAHAHVLAFEELLGDKKCKGKAYFIGQESPVNLWDFINKMLAKAGVNPITNFVSFRIAFLMGGVLEFLFKIFGIKSPEPPMTRFIALQLAKSHYFSHENAKRDFNYQVIKTIDEGLEELTR